MKVLQLGNGGGFDIESTSSAFLIRPTDNTYILFDCGWGILAKLKDLHNDPTDNFTFDKIDCVFISHMHEDHIANLSTFIYYNYFIQKNFTNIIFEEDGPMYHKLDAYLDICHSKLENGKVVATDMYELIELYCGGNDTDYSLETIIGDHATVPSSGLVITTDTSFLYISGDTKATANIEENVKHYQNKKRTTKLFHDYSNWDDPLNNVHACKSDIASEYSKEFANQLIYYHTNTLFNQKWQDI